MTAVVEHVVASIAPVSPAMASAARAVVASAGVDALDRLAERLAAAQHTPRPHARRVTMIVAAAPSSSLIRLASAAELVLISLSELALDNSIDAGIALVVSLIEGGTDVLAVTARDDTHQAILVGVILAAAAMQVPVMLDGPATGEAARAAVARAPHAAGYLIATHGGLGQATLAALQLTPVFQVGLGSGDGSGVVIVAPLARQVAALVGA